MVTANVLDAKTHFSDYLARVEAGEEIIISRRNKPIAKLVPIEQPKPKRQFGFDNGKIKITDGAFDPIDKMSDADIIAEFGPDWV